LRVLGEKREEQEVRKERRKRNLVWRRIEGDGLKERCGCLRRLLEKLGRKVRVKRVEERLGEGGRRLLLVIMKKGEDGDKVLERKEEI